MIPFVLGYNLFLGINVENYDKEINIYSFSGETDKTQEVQCPVLLFPARVLQGRPDKPVVACRSLCSGPQEFRAEIIAYFSL